MNATSTTSLPDSCPAPAELHSFALGKLPVATHERLASHVEACSRCQTALESTTLRGDSLLADIDRAAKLDTSPHEVRTPPTTGTLGGYEIVRELGRGGMGVVYLVRQPGADRLVALKQLRSDALLGSTLEEREEVLERFRSEARAAGRLTHTGVFLAARRPMRESG